MPISAGQVISTILKHDRKETSYKIALLRAINDVALSYPDLATFDQDVAIPLRLLAEYWLAYYWPFVHPTNPILQGKRPFRGGQLSSDMAYRNALTSFRSVWETAAGGPTGPSEGFFIINELRIPRKRSTYSRELLAAYDAALRTIAATIPQPIKYAGPGHWTVFPQPALLADLPTAVPIPATSATETCLLITADLWRTFREMSLWVEALCIHEWCLFTERIDQDSSRHIDRGQVYSLLTARPDNRRPLTWERNHVDLLLMEGKHFVCPWTQRAIHRNTPYDLDHLVPIAVYPINELWNLVPSDPDFNSHKKRDLLPSPDRLVVARPHLVLAYSNYQTSQSLDQAIHQDAALRFTTLPPLSSAFPDALAGSVINFINQVADARNLARF